jgi:hypothetical protein
VNHLVDAPWRHAEALRGTILRKPERLQKLLLEDLAGMNRRPLTPACQ